LCAVAIGTICIEVLLFFAQMTHPVALVRMVLATAFLLALSDIFNLLARLYSLVSRAAHGSRLEKTLIACAALVLLVEGLAAMAPVTGSGALQLHFTVPQEVLQEGFRPDFFLPHSFSTGQSHLLVLAGLAQGSERLAMGLLFLGGVLAAAATACLAHRWTTREWAWLAALIFALPPLVFWRVFSPPPPTPWFPLFPPPPAPSL